MRLSRTTSQSGGFHDRLSASKSAAHDLSGAQLVTPSSSAMPSSCPGVLMLLLGVALLPQASFAQKCTRDADCSACKGFCADDIYNGKYDTSRACVCPPSACSPYTCSYLNRSDKYCQCSGSTLVLCGKFDGKKCQQAYASNATAAPRPASPPPPPSKQDDSGNSDSVSIPGLDIFFFVYSLASILFASVTMVKKLRESRESSAGKDVLWHVLRKIYVHGSVAPSVKVAKIILKDCAKKGNSKTVHDSIGQLILIQTICIVLTILRLFEFNFAGCSTRSCNRMAGANVFSGLLAVINVVLAFVISAPCEALAYKSDASVLWKIFETFVIFTHKGISLAWQAYESSGQSSQISASDKELVWLYIMVGFVASGLMESFSISLDLACKWSGCHTFLRTAMEHNFIFRIVMICFKPCMCGMGVVDGQARWLEAYAAAQSEMKMEGDTLPSDLDLTYSKILTRCGWSGGDAHALLDRLKRDTDREGNWIAGGHDGAPQYVSSFAFASI
jgi:hypothetical protein